MPDEIEAERLLRFARETLAEAGQAALAHFRRQPDVVNKAAAGHFDPVTAADREAEAVIRSRIADAWPDHGVLGEEGGGTLEDSDPCWVIDPIDGTRGFISGFAQWGMLLAFSVGGRPVLGALHQPWVDETWLGRPLRSVFHRGAADSGTVIEVRPCAELSAAVLSSTDPYLFRGEEAEVFDGLRRDVRLTRYGGDCYAYGLLASGQLDLVVESGLSPWDIQALIPIVEGAGGHITDWRGEDCSAGGQVVASGDARLHEAVLERLAPAARAQAGEKGVEKGGQPT